MDTKILKVIGILALAVAAVVTIKTMLDAGQWNIDLRMMIFIGWAVSPYVVFFAASALLERFASTFIMSTIFCIISVLMLASTLFFYVGTLTGESSTEALIFIFAPVYLYIGSFIALAVGFGASKLFGRAKPNSAPLP